MMPGATSAEFAPPISEALHVRVANMLRSYSFQFHRFRGGTLRAALPGKHLEDVLL